MCQISITLFELNSLESLSVFNECAVTESVLITTFSQIHCTTPV